jgi:hypothetical protein
MSSTDKYFASVVRMTKWTGSNLTELSTIWADELAANNTEFTVNEDGDLVAGNGFFGFDYPVPEGRWFRPGTIRGTEEAYLFTNSAEINPMGLA